MDVWHRVEPGAGAPRRSHGSRALAVSWHDAVVDPFPTEPADPPSADAEERAWAASGAMALTGERYGSCWVPAGAVATRLNTVAAELKGLTAGFGSPVRVDGAALLGERAALAGMERRGSTSVGGAAHMVAARDGWVAVNLARPEDLDLVPAWLGEAVDVTDWAAIAATLRQRPVDDLVVRAQLVGLPAAAVRQTAELDPTSFPARPGRVESTGVGVPLGGLDGRPLVLELASLWAGPLCGSLLGATGFDVVKIEHPGRPDGARRGPAAFFDLLNGAKRSLALDLRSGVDRAIFEALAARAAVVIDGSRPRVAENLGVDVASIVECGTVWLSITGYGRVGPQANQPAFGDDAAVAGGLVVPSGEPGLPDRPLFVADAAADPITGLIAAVAALKAVRAGRGALVDLPMAQSVAWAIGSPTIPGLSRVRQSTLRAEPPRGRSRRDRAHALDADRSAIIDLVGRPPIENGLT